MVRPSFFECDQSNYNTLPSSVFCSHPYSPYLVLLPDVRRVRLEGTPRGESRERARVSVKGIDGAGGRRALHCNHIEFAAPLPWIRGEDLVKAVCHQDRHAVLRRGRLHARGQIDVRGEISSIDLMSAPHGAFDGPASVQAEPHVQFKGFALLALQPWVGAQGLELLVPLQGD